MPAKEVINLDINERLRRLRKALGFKMTDFADLVGISQSSLSSLESRTRKVSEKHIKLICAAFPQVSENWLRCGEGDMFRQNDNDYIDTVCENLGLDDVAKSMLRAYVQLDSQSKRIVSDYIRNAAADIMKRSAGNVEPADEIESDVAAYRAARELEKKATERSSHCNDTAGANGAKTR